MDKENIEKMIRKNWFKDHRAVLEQHGDLQVLEWGKPGTNFYRVRYVFDGHKMYVSGDIGEAVFWLTWKANVHSFNDIYIGYFEEKLQAYSGERRDFNSEEAVKRLRERLNELKENEIEYDHDTMRELFEETRSCSSKSEWIEIAHRYEGFISEFDCDCWEWIYCVGDEIPKRIFGYLIGLQMASEQLNKNILK